MAAVTTGHMNTGATNGTQKARLWSVGAQYKNGPIAAGVAYEKHQNFYGAAVGGTGGCGASTVPPVVPGCLGSDERAWAIQRSYTFPVGKGLKLGPQYSQQKADTNALTGANAKVKAWHVGIDWNIAGPHSVMAAYTRAGDMKGTPGAAMGQRPVVNALGSTNA
jgi:predicted porin